MTISVVMTTYNGEKFIVRQLDSLKNQTRRIDEVIIADDCSHDNTAAVIEQYISDNSLSCWNLVRNEHNKGYIENYLDVIEKASGDIIFLCDQDDEWNSDKIEKLSDIISNDDRILVLNSGVRLIDADGNPIIIREKHGRSNINIIKRKCGPDELVRFDYTYLVFGNISPGCALCFKKELKQELLKYKELPIEMNCPHDWYINRLSSLFNGTYYYNHSYTRYRIHHDNTIGLKRKLRPDFRETKLHRKQAAEECLKTFSILYNDAELRSVMTADTQRLLDKQMFIYRSRAEFTADSNLIKWIKMMRYPFVYRKTVRLSRMLSDFVSIFQ